MRPAALHEHVCATGGECARCAPFAFNPILKRGLYRPERRIDAVERMALNIALAISADGHDSARSIRMTRDVKLFFAADFPRA